MPKEYFWNKESKQGGGTNIWVPNELKRELDELKIHPRESYYEVIMRLKEKANCHDLSQL